MSYPSWLSEEYFEEILRRSKKNTSICVQEVTLGPCGAANDGFLSTLLCADVAYVVDAKKISESFVVKLSTTQDLAIQKVGKSGYDVQNKEMLFFEVIAPQIVKVLTKVDENENLIPNTYAIDRTFDAIVFEDLKKRNFVMVDRNVGLDEVQTKMALKKLANFHAASLIIKQKHPDAFRPFNAGMFSRSIDAFNFAFNSIFELAAEEIVTWKGYEKYGRKLMKMRGSFIELATRCFDVYAGDFCVLNHGDLWTNNLMFKFDANGKTEDVILIDFQFCHWGSPSLDLMHLLYTSLQEELYDQQHIESLAQFYYYELKNVIQKLNYDLKSLPTLHEFQLDFVKKMFYGLVYTLVVLPIMTSDDPDNDFTAHHADDERAVNFKRRILKAPKYQKIVKKMLAAFDQKGILDDTLPKD